MLNRMQENDESQINFMKYNLMKFSQIVDSMGKMIHDKGENLSDTADMINSETDIKIFIDHHKSTNLVVNKERFMYYDDKQESPLKHSRTLTATALLETDNNSKSDPIKREIKAEVVGSSAEYSGKLKEQLVINDNYMLS